ncbi:MULTISPECIES: type III polyketide synthase [Streptomyces]|uniref:PhlD n=1 Tax=Streptomyces solicathayae TaxID=3081768 RepID=A0ABZ0LKX6_9ACTN|nr:PhlD [Streptomyces sp. HUAS YS2]WOX20079.1 PhlD [Streptomyces sp. HUAS YS2]
MAYVARPAIALPEHVVTTDELCDDIRRAHPDLPRLEAYLRIARATTVKTRHFTRPLSAPTVSGSATIEERNRAAYEDALELAVTAGRRAIENAGLEPADIDAVVTSHTTSWTVPSLDVSLVHRLGLRPGIRRMPMATVGCAGGAQAIVNARKDIVAHPGAHVLVVVAECLSTATYNHADTSRESVIYKTLFGDGSGAVVVSGDPRWTGPSVRIEDTFEYVLPDSMDRYQGRLDGTGLHFDSTEAATRALDDSFPAVRTWLAGRPLDFAVVHPGGPRILTDAAKALGLHPDPATGDLSHAWASLAEHGNLGGSAILDVLARTFTSPPAADSEGLLIGFGPGFVLAAAHARWIGDDS